MLHIMREELVRNFQYGATRLCKTVNVISRAYGKCEIRGSILRGSTARSASHRVVKYLVTTASKSPAAAIMLQVSRSAWPASAASARSSVAIKKSLSWIAVLAACKELYVSVNSCGGE
jgi:hypothetical protein